MTNSTRFILCAAALVTMATGAAAQDNGQDGYRGFRTNTWSLYAEGGASGVTDLGYSNVSSSLGTNVAPLAGFGIDYNVRPQLCIPTSDTAEPEVLTVRFGLGEAKVSAADESRLEGLAREMTADQTVEISLTAEASADGNDASNQRLSERRLKNVMKILNDNGIDGSRIRSARAIGASNKVYDPSVRRVEILVYK